MFDANGARVFPSPSPAAEAFPWPRIQALDRGRFREVNLSEEGYRVLARPFFRVLNRWFSALRPRWRTAVYYCAPFPRGAALRRYAAMGLPLVQLPQRQHAAGSPNPDPDAGGRRNPVGVHLLARRQRQPAGTPT